MAQSKRSFVDKLDFITSLGHGDGSRAAASASASRTKGPTRVITDLCLMEPDAETRELTVTAMHPGVTREQITAATGWPVKFAAKVAETAAADRRGARGAARPARPHQGGHQGKA